MNLLEIGYLIIFEIVSIIIGSIIIGLIIKNERNRKKYIPTIKVGDSVYTPSLSDKINGEVLEIHEDSIVMKVTVSKNRVYPKN